MYLAGYLMNELYIYTSVVLAQHCKFSTRSEKATEKWKAEFAGTLRGFHFIREDKTIHLYVYSYICKLLHTIK